MDVIGNNIGAWLTATIATLPTIFSTKSVKSVDAATHAFNDAGDEDRKAANLGRELNVLRMKSEQRLSQTGT
jgi:hypothetical protein